MLSCCVFFFISENQISNMIMGAWLFIQYVIIDGVCYENRDHRHVLGQGDDLLSIYDLRYNSRLYNID
ncbi:hypothetical protein D3Z50_00380 [Clostridiaceae bacterium]|nr:hypothetical protein [Clostridiaceae bacterium]